MYLNKKNWRAQLRVRNLCFFCLSVRSGIYFQYNILIWFLKGTFCAVTLELASSDRSALLALSKQKCRITHNWNQSYEMKLFGNLTNFWWKPVNDFENNTETLNAQRISEQELRFDRTIANIVRSGSWHAVGGAPANFIRFLLSSIIQTLCSFF